MVVFENLPNLSDRDVIKLMREVSSDVLLVALRGADEAVRHKIMSNMSRRAADLLRDDLETCQSNSAIKTAQKDIMSVRQTLGRGRRNYPERQGRPACPRSFQATA